MDWNYFDNDGYPTEETLERIRVWDHTEDYHKLMEFVQGAWHWGSDFYIMDKIDRGIEYTFITGGWSGNEELIAALRENRMFWIFCWWSSNAGGRHVFRVRE